MSIANKRYLEAFDEAIINSCGSLNSFFQDYCNLPEKDVEAYRQPISPIDKLASRN